MATATATPLTDALKPFLAIVAQTSGASAADALATLPKCMDEIGRLVKAQIARKGRARVEASRPAWRPTAIAASREHGGQPVLLSRVKPGASVLADINDAAKVPADVVSALSNMERNMYTALCSRQKPGRALAITLASFRGAPLPDNDPAAAGVKAARAQHAANVAASWPARKAALLAKR